MSRIVRRLAVRALFPRPCEIGYALHLSAAKRTDSVMRTLWLVLLALPAALAQQPLEFPHNTHVEKAGMRCIDCHSRADVQDRAGIPSIRKCMLCHKKIGTELPEVVRLTEYWDKKREVPWVRVYEFSEEAAVQFRHSPHVRAQIGCSQCHGDVAAMSVAVEAVEHTMGTCISCHRENNASDDCVACHY